MQAINLTPFEMREHSGKTFDAIKRGLEHDDNPTSADISIKLSIMQALWEIAAVLNEMRANANHQ